jgi:hypothetical protein
MESSDSKIYPGIARAGMTLHPNDPQDDSHQPPPAPHTWKWL